MTQAANQEQATSADEALVARAQLVAGSRFRCTVGLRWSDTDSFHHINNVVYFRLMEEARVQLFLRTELALPPGKVPVLASASCDFLRPLYYPATPVVSLTFVKVGRASLELAVSMALAGEEEKPFATGRNVIVWMDTASGKSEPWPSELLVEMARKFV